MSVQLQPARATGSGGLHPVVSQLVSLLNLTHACCLKKEAALYVHKDAWPVRSVDPIGIFLFERDFFIVIVLCQANTQASLCRRRRLSSTDLLRSEAVPPSMERSICQ